MSYEMNINAGVTGVEQIDRLGTATDKQTERTRRVDEAVRTYAANSDKLAAKLLDVQKVETQLEKTREQHRMQTERLAAATDKQTVSQEKLNGAMKSHVSDVQAASAAIRAFEGHLPVRAVEQFSTKILGLGPLMQAAFPVVGAIALVEVMGRAAEGAKHLYDHFVLLKDAQAELTRGAKELASEYEQSFAKVQRYLAQTLRDQGNFQAAAQVEIRGAASATIKLPEYNKEKLESTLGFGGLESYQLRNVKNAYAPVIPADLGRRISQIQNRLHTLDLDLENYQSGGPVRINAAAQDQTRLEKEAYEILLPVLEQKQREFDADKAAIQAKADKEVADKAKAAAEKRASENKQLDQYRRSVTDKGLESPIARALIDGQYKVLEAPDRLRDDYAGTASLSLADAAREQQKKDAERVIKDWMNGPSFDRDAKFLQQRMSANARNDAASLQEMEKELRDMRGALGERAEGDLRNLRTGERRYTALARVQAQLSGTSQRDQIDSQASERIRFANQEYELQLKINFAKLDGLKKEEADKAALDAKNEKIFEAQMEREQAILEMVLKVKQEFEKNAVGLVHAAATGHLGGFVRGRVESLGDEVLGKLAGKLFDVILDKARPKTISIRDVIGGAAKDDPAIAATDDNTRATDDNTRALRDLTTALQRGGAGTASDYPVGSISFPNGSAGPGIPTSTASTINYGFPPSGGGSGSGSRPGAGAVVAAAGVGYAGVSNIAKGGARNTVAGVGEVAAAAALVDPEPVSKLVLAGIALGATAVSAFLGDPKAARAAQIQTSLSLRRYIDPVQIHASMTTGGGYADYDRFGGLRGSDLSPFPSTQSGYLGFDPQRTIVPGRTLNDFGGGPPITINVSATDAKSIVDRSQDIGDAVLRALDTGHLGLQEKLRSL